METTGNGAAERAKGCRMPAIFAAHGAPILLDDAVWMGELAAWAKAMPLATMGPLPSMLPPLALTPLTVV